MEGEGHELADPHEFDFSAWSRVGPRQAHGFKAFRMPSLSSFCAVARPDMPLLPSAGSTVAWRKREYFPTPINYRSRRSQGHFMKELIVNTTRKLFVLSIFMVQSPLSCSVAAQQEVPQSEEPEAGKIVLDLAVGTTPLDFDRRLEIVRSTYKDMVSENIKPDMILIIRSLTGNWLSRSRQQMWAQEAIDKIVAKLNAFREKPGVQLVADQPVHEVMKKKAKALLPGVKVVRNGFIALLRYHQEGYLTISLN
jgi:hypothetical protein